MADQRPDPDELLRRLREDERRQQRGKLTLFFGAAPGVGKTYAMLLAARAERAEGRNVVVGVVETHGRPETAALAGGLEALPSRSVVYHGVRLEEFDLDAALARRPELILLDELAHTNAEGSRHPKRWQDVEELLDAGVDVFSTLNVQHVESLNDVVAKITGIQVRETVPDSVLEEAHEIKLVDLPPDDLLERLRDGKVYVSGQAQRALDNFFRKGNLIALRELALRQTAERVDAQMRAYRSAQGIEQTWAAADRLLVAVSTSPSSPRLVRATRRMAGALHAQWFAVNVEVSGHRPLSRADLARLSANLHLARQLGAQVVTLAGQDAARELLRFSRDHNITKIIVGKPVVTSLLDRLRSSLVDQLVRQSGDIDVYVTAGDPGEQERLPAEDVRSPPLPVATYLTAISVVLPATLTSLLLFGREQLPDVVMVYLLGIMLVASRFSLRPSLAAALASVAAFDFFFVPPFLTFSVGDFSHVVTFFVMFLVAAVISGLTDRIRSQAAAARQREQRTAALYQLSRELAGAVGSQPVIEAGARQLEQAFASKVTVFTRGTEAALTRAYASPGLDAAERDASISHWVWSNRREAGLGTGTLPSSATLYVPLLASSGVVGVVGLLPSEPERLTVLDEKRQLEAFATQLALALERATLSEEAERAHRAVETEQLRSSLLSSVSHDLRTPLAVITGAASTLLQQPPALDLPTQQDLTKTILEEAERLHRLIRNLLDMTRLESGGVKVRKDWSLLEEIIGSALDRLEPRLAGREVQVDLPRDLPLVPFDPVLIEQLLVNLLENAAKYGEGCIDISARQRGATEVEVQVADRGPGIPPGEEERIFQKFHRAVNERNTSGVGLGLTICRAIVTAHEGRIWAHNREGGGAVIHFTLPIQGQPPQVLLAEPSQRTLAEGTP